MKGAVGLPAAPFEIKFIFEMHDENARGAYRTWEHQPIILAFARLMLNDRF